MKRWTFGIIVSAGVCFFLSVSIVKAAQQRPVETTVILGGTLIDGTGRQTVPDAVVVIEDSTIKAVGPSGKVSYPPGAKIIDARGKYVLPGLIDSHVHYRDWVAELFLHYGITTVNDMGNPTDWILAQRDGIAKGKIVGPRIFAAGGQLGNLEPAENPEQARETVRSLIARGVDQIAASRDQDVPTLRAVIEEAHKGGRHVTVAYSTDPRAAISMGLDSLEHSFTLGIASHKGPEILKKMEQLRTAKFPFYRSLFETDPFDFLMQADNDDLVQLIVSHGTYSIPSLIFEYKTINDRREEFLRENLELLSNPNLRYIPYENYIAMARNDSEGGLTKGPFGMFGAISSDGADFKRYQQSYRNLQAFIHKLVQAGGKVLAAADGPNLLAPGLSLHHELRLLVDAGLTPMQAIQACTQWPSGFIRQQDRLGTVEAGKIADVIVVRENPLDNIANLRKIDLVMKDGKILDTRFHPDFANPIPRTNNTETQMNPLPVVTNLLPQVATEGDAEVKLTVQGRDFARSSLVLFDGSRLPTTMVKYNELKAVIPGRLLTRVGTYPITVWTPRPGGGTSQDAKFIVRFR